MRKPTASGSAQSRWALIVLLIAYLLFSVFQINRRGLWYDELYSTLTALSPTFQAMYDKWMSSDGFPFGFHPLLFAWLKLVPAEDIWVRLPCFLASLATLLFIGTVVRRKRGDFVAATCIGLLLCSYNFLYYSYTVRVYSFLALFSWIALFQMLDLLQKDELKTFEWPFFLTATILSYLHYFGVFFVLCLLAFLFFSRFLQQRKPKREILFYVFFGLAHILVCFPNYIHLRYLLSYGYGKWQTTSHADFLGDFVKKSSFLSTKDCLAYFAALLSFLGLAWWKAPKSDRSPFLGFWRSDIFLFATFGLFSIALVSLAYKLNQERYFIPFFAVFALAYASLLERLMASSPKMRKAFGLVLLIFVALSFRSFNATAKQDWRKSTYAVKDALGPDDEVYVLTADQHFTGKDYLESGNVDGYFYVRTLDFYSYYFRQAFEQPPPLKPFNAFDPNFADNLHPAAHKVFILAPHHLKLKDEQRQELERNFRIEEQAMYSTRLYTLRPLR